ncbi:formate dehydrogenase accessory sulfurtransferase FdhD [Rhodococcus oxybenzonivorans]|uniref:formate dehydrogenase accessory sulfurtransferase FdhD n=1 Tax=Rhodococcus oxybenzonivorans TaxID=1990687 RepID=UPI0037C81555
MFTATGDLLTVKEDVGRHNAVDKLIGWATAQGRIPLRGSILLVSGRASFELAQKAVMAGIPVLAAVSAPSSLVIDLAHDTGLTLVESLRGTSLTSANAFRRLDGCRYLEWGRRSARRPSWAGVGGPGRGESADRAKCAEACHGGRRHGEHATTGRRRPRRGVGG